MAVFVASFAAKAQDRTCKTDSICGREIVKSAMKYLGSPYRSGHMSPKSGFDCSGFTTFIFSKQNISLPRSSRSQYSALRGDSQVKDRRDLKAGDLVFFSGHRDIGRRIGQLQVYPLKLFARCHGIVVTGSLLRKALHRCMPCG